MLIVVFEVVDLLEGLVVTVSSLLNVSYYTFVLKVKSPVFLEIVHLLLFVDWFLQGDRSWYLHWGLRISLRAIG